MFLQALVNQRMNSEGLSLRKAAGQIGIAHTTLASFLKGTPTDLGSLQLICKWMNVSVRDALGFDTDNDTAAAVATILEMEPELAEIFRKAAVEVQDGMLKAEEFREIIRYSAYRLNSVKEQKVTQ